MSLYDISPPDGQPFGGCDNGCAREALTEIRGRNVCESCARDMPRVKAPDPLPPQPDLVSWRIVEQRGADRVVAVTTTEADSLLSMSVDLDATDHARWFAHPVAGPALDDELASDLCAEMEQYDHWRDGYMPKPEHFAEAA